jgi:uncharacterized protein (DUF1697 family)
MKKQIAFLRGINVGNIRIKMPDLKLTFERLGFQQVKTYLQSGNVNYEAFVLLYDFDVLSNIVDKYPFEREESHHAYIVFIDNEAIFEELKSLAASTEEPTASGNQVIYWKVVKGESLDTPFSKTLAKAKYKKNTTVRNINTLEKMVEII